MKEGIDKFYILIVHKISPVTCSRYVSALGLRPACRPVTKGTAVLEWRKICTVFCVEQLPGEVCSQLYY
jgi:hypothetical protein